MLFQSQIKSNLKVDLAIGSGRIRCLHVREYPAHLISGLLVRVIPRSDDNLRKTLPISKSTADFSAIARKSKQTDFSAKKRKFKVLRSDLKPESKANPNPGHPGYPSIDESRRDTPGFNPKTSNFCRFPVTEERLRVNLTTKFR